MSRRDELSAALARIEAMRDEIRAAETSGGDVADLRDRVEALERTLAELRSPHGEGSSSSARRERRARSEPLERLRPLPIVLTVVVGVATFMVLMVLVPNGRYYGDKGLALMQWSLGVVLLTAGTGVLGFRAKWRWLGVPLLVIGVVVYWTAWSWARRLGVVTFLPFE